MATEGTIGLKEEVAERRSKLIRLFDLSAAQGVLPFTNEDYHEQANPIVRSALFAVTRTRDTFVDWVEIFSLGGTIRYKGPQLTVHHEMLFTRILVRARGRSLTKPVPFTMTEALKWLDLKDSGANRTRIRGLLEDLKEARVRIASKSALGRLYNILTRKDLADRPGGSALRTLVEDRYTDYLPMIVQSYNGGEPFEIDLDFIGRIATQGRSRRLHIELDPMMALLFDGVNTTLLPFEIWDTLDPFGKRLLSFVASHRDGVYKLLLESYHRLSGSKSEYTKVERRFKSDFMARLRKYEALQYIEPNWDVVRNRDDKWLVTGLKAGPAIKIQSELFNTPVALLSDSVDSYTYDKHDSEVESEIAPEQKALL